MEQRFSGMWKRGKQKKVATIEKEAVAEAKKANINLDIVHK